jgi:SAM-dependent methyltransferase
MLAHAQVNAPDCRLLRADARDFAFHPALAGILSTGNSLNYLLNLGDVQRVLANVHRSLLPGGIFCSDILLTDFQLPPRMTDRLVEQDLVAVWQESFDAATGFLKGDQILFYRQGESWQRCDRPYFTQLYQEAEIRNALLEAGFTDFRLFSAEHDLGFDLRARTFIVAEKGPDA